MPPCAAQSSARQNKYNTGAVRVATLDELKVGVWGAGVPGFSSLRDALRVRLIGWGRMSDRLYIDQMESGLII
jgi:hypothetical protein